jgi:C4-dicarboxylate-specific signal transduction histidine kinase
MRRVAEIFGSALVHKFTQEELDRALGFERLASQILASIFLEHSANEGDVIKQGLRDIGQFLRVDWVSLWERLPKRDSFRPIYGWQMEGVETTPDASSWTWLNERLVAGSTVNVGGQTEWPSRTEAEVPALDEDGARSLLAVPIASEGRVNGALVFGSAHGDRAWPEAMIPGVKLIAETFASLNARLSAERRKKVAEIEASQWRERLAQLVRVHTVGEMSAALAHEITQPVGAIENYALAARRRLGEDVPDLRRVGELLDKVLGQATRAGDVVMRMRGMVQRHELETKEIDIARAITDCVEMVKMDCELRNIDVEVRPVGPLPMVAADEIHLQQVILNLLRNAMDAVQMLPPDRRRSIAIDAGLDGDDKIFVDVADHGPGIAECDLERVFESFYTTKPNGLGIGLAICRKLIEAHGGTLHAVHNPSGGALFRLTLPVTSMT